MAGSGHLVKRFFGSLVPVGPGKDAEAWVAEHLLDGERELWRRMRRADRRHAYGVARRVERALGNEATRPILAAALLHDVGKTDAGLGTYGRVIATLSGKVAGHEMAAVWRTKRGFTRKVGLYLHHPDLGGDQLELAGAAPITVAWAREHHKPPEEWSVPLAIGTVLKEADDD